MFFGAKGKKKTSACGVLLYVWLLIRFKYLNGTSHLPPVLSAPSCPPPFLSLSLPPCSFNSASEKNSVETVVLPDNGFGGLPAGMNHWQIVNATARSMAGGADWKRRRRREGGERGRRKNKPGNERQRIKAEIQLAPPVCSRGEAKPAPVICCQDTRLL